MLVRAMWDGEGAERAWAGGLWGTGRDKQWKHSSPDLGIFLRPMKRNERLVMRNRVLDNRLPVF